MKGRFKWDAIEDVEEGVRDKQEIDQSIIR